MKIKSSILLTVFILLTAIHVNGQTIFSSTVSLTSPPMTALGVPGTVNRSQGRKGFTMLFYRSSDSSPIVITAPAGAVSFTLGGVAKTVEANTLTPAPGNAGYAVVKGYDGDSVNNGLEIVFNGDFNAGDSISITVNGVIGTGGLAQDQPYTLLYTAGSTLLRSPLTLALVLDVSGSMSQNIVGGAGPRMDALHHAVEVLLNTAKAHTMLGDKIGVVYFTTTARSMDLPPSGSPFLVNAHIEDNLTAVINDVNAHDPEAATSIGRGLIKARDELFTESPAGNTKYIMLFSDGENNTPSLTDVTSPPLRITGVAFDPSAAITKICPFTLGTTSTPGNALMSSIATAGCPAPGGNSHVLDVPVGMTSVDAQLMEFFQNTVADLVVGDKLEMSKSVSGTLQPGVVKTEKVLVNPKDIAMTLALSWSSKRIQVLAFQLKAPDGTVINLQHVTIHGQQNNVTTLTLPVLRNRVNVPHAGEWEVIIDGNQLDGFTTDYHLSVMLDNSEIATSAEIIGTDVGTGEDIPLRVNLKENGAPITGATVIAQLVAPSQGVGNILSQQPTPAGNPNPAGDVFGSNAQAKLQLLLTNPSTAGLFIANGLPAVPLFDDGAPIHNDAVAGDGIYNAVFKDARQEGHYNFTFVVKGNTAGNGNFERTRTHSVFVRPKPVAANTNLSLLSSTRQPDGSVIVRLRATPRDRFNNFIGPDHLGYMNIRCSQGTVSTPLEDKLDGSYEISCRLPSAASNPDITVAVMGADVVTRPLNTLNSTGAFKRWGLSLHAGSTFPHGFFGNVFDPGFSFGADLEYRFTQLFSVEAYLGHDRFKNQFFNDTFYMTHLSGQAKFTFGSGTVRPSTHFGLGAYFPEGGGTRFGANVGASVQFWLTPNFAIEPGYNYRAVNFSGSVVKYSTLQGGVRFRF